MSEEAVFDKKNVLVTGGAGFIGSFLCERLLKDGYRVICVDNLVTSDISNIEQLLKFPEFEFVKADISDSLDLEKMPELEKFKVRFQGIQEIYHLACPMAIKNFEKHQIATLRANSVGMVNVLEMAAKYKSKFFLASTSMVYGSRPEDGHLFGEGELGKFDHLTPRGCYDEGRRWVETMAHTYSLVYGLDVRIARIFRTYGPRLPLADGHMLPDFIMNALDGNDLVIFGDENFRTSLVYVTDVVDGILQLMKSSKNPGVINLGSDYDIKLVDVARKVIELTGSSSEVTFGDPLLFMSELGLPDITRAKSELGWIPLVSLDQGLKRLIEYTEANRHLLRMKYGE